MPPPTREVRTCLVPFVGLLNHSPYPHAVHFSQCDPKTRRLRCVPPHLFTGKEGVGDKRFCNARPHTVCLSGMLPHTPNQLFPCKGCAAAKFQRHSLARSVRCFRPCSSGQQVFLSYGPLSNSKLLLTYGFALPGNPNDDHPLTLQVGWLGQVAPSTSLLARHTWFTFQCGQGGPSSLSVASTLLSLVFNPSAWEHSPHRTWLLPNTPAGSARLPPPLNPLACRTLLLLEASLLRGCRRLSLPWAPPGCGSHRAWGWAGRSRPPCWP